MARDGIDFFLVARCRLIDLSIDSQLGVFLMSLASRWSLKENNDLFKVLVRFGESLLDLFLALTNQLTLQSLLKSLVKVEVPLNSSADAPGHSRCLQVSDRYKAVEKMRHTPIHVICFFGNQESFRLAETASVA